MFNRI